ncbi:MAG: FAD-dependent oxidoreductase, partial [Pyrinomonadaceae bacterium]
RLSDTLKSITVEANGERRDLEAEEILTATGRQPNIGGLNLEAAGVVYDAERIHTDAYLRTTQPHIYAAGDVTGHFPFTHMAAYEAAVVVRNALFFWPLTQKADFRVVPWTTFTDPEVARVGLTEREAREQHGERNVTVYRAEFADNDRAQTEAATDGFAKLVTAGRKGEIVGAHIVGAHAGELIHEIVLAMKHRLPASALGGMIHVYPTLTQVNQKAGLDAVLAKIAPYRKSLSRYFAWRRR